MGVLFCFFRVLQIVAIVAITTADINEGFIINSYSEEDLLLINF